MQSIAQLEDKLATPSDALVREIAELDGDILLLGIGGKMGPSLARLAINAIRKAGISKKVIGASRLSDPLLRHELEAAGVETHSVDLLDESALQSLPNVKNVIYMAGNKFGTSGNESFSWAMNAYLPGLVAEKYKDSRIVAFSTGNVYPLTPIGKGGAIEEDAPAPVGEYAQSCLGRERVFEYFSRKNGTPLTIFRLNYAIDLRYGVLLEVAKSVKAGLPIDLGMGHFNCIWQGDANEMALRSLLITSSPANVINVTGPETVPVRWLAERFGEALGIEPIFTGEESATALLSNTTKSFRIFGYPQVTLGEMVEWVGNWVANAGETWNKPTHFQERKGKF